MGDSDFWGYNTAIYRNVATWNRTQTGCFMVVDSLRRFLLTGEGREKSYM
jgi:hypothetical protein